MPGGDACARIADDTGQSSLRGTDRQPNGTIENRSSTLPKDWDSERYSIVAAIQATEQYGLFLLLCASKEGFTMGHVIRLQLIGRVTYYVGWIALICGGLSHLSAARAAFLAVNLTKRNLLEVSVMCFLICIASELRARPLPGN